MFKTIENVETNATSILVIEKHPIMHNALCAAISGEEDLKVLGTSPGIANAFQLRLSSRYEELFLAKKPDIILLSLGNPGLDDLQALIDLRTKLLDTPILALVTDEVPGQEQVALRYGAQAVLSKSISREGLLEVLRTIKKGSQFTLQ